jgi:hypothetical protein
MGTCLGHRGYSNLRHGAAGDFLDMMHINPGIEDAAVVRHRIASDVGGIGNDDDVASRGQDHRGDVGMQDVLLSHEGEVTGCDRTGGAHQALLGIETDSGR